MRPRLRPDPSSFLVEIFAVSAATLVLEISYTRIISFKLYYYYTYLVIGLALLGLGSGAVLVAVSRRLAAWPTRSLLRGLSLAAAAAVVAGYVAIAVMPLDTLALWSQDRSASIVAVLQLVGICIGLYVSFLPIGMIIATLFARRPDQINRLYFADLAGAALACVVVVPLMAWVGPTIAIAGVAAALLLVAVRLADRERGSSAVWAVGIAAAVVVVLLGPQLAPDIRTEESKGVRPGTPLAASRWSALFRVDALELPENTLLFHDGIWGSSIWPWDGDPASLGRFDTDDRSVPFAALGQPPERLLIIGAAGGNEIAAALHFGVEEIDAVELNPETARLLRGRYADYSGHLTTQPGVRYIVGDGRSFLAESDERYDMIWFVAPDSYAASNAASSGAFVLSESYLYTQEMLEEALAHVTDSGMVVMQFGEKDYASRPNRTSRLVATARDAYRDRGIAPFADHVAVVSSTAEGFLYGASTTMMKTTPFTADELDRIEAKVPSVPGLQARYLPGRAGDDPGAPVNQLITLDDAGADAFIASYPYDIRPIDDNRPFFWHFTPYREALGQLTTPVENIDVEIGIGERVLLLLLGVAIVLAAVFLLGPLVVARERWRALPDKATTAPIFGLLGLAFIAFEITLIQQFALFLGYPTYSLTVTLMALLLSTGIGALVSQRWHARADRLLLVLAAAIVALGALYIVVTPRLVDALQSAPLPAKALIVAALCAPLGFCLGMFMPLTITLVARDRAHTTEYVAWGWAINGFFSVIGSTLTTIVSMTYGFRTVLVAAVALYLVVVVLLRRLVHVGDFGAERGMLEHGRLPSGAQQAFEADAGIR